MNAVQSTVYCWLVRTDIPDSRWYEVNRFKFMCIANNRIISLILCFIFMLRLLALILLTFDFLLRIVPSFDTFNILDMHHFLQCSFHFLFERSTIGEISEYMIQCPAESVMSVGIKNDVAHGSLNIIYDNIETLI